MLFLLSFVYKSKTFDFQFLLVLCCLRSPAQHFERLSKVCHFHDKNSPLPQHKDIGTFPSTLWAFWGAWEWLYRKPILRLLGGRLIFKGNSIHSSGYACHHSPTDFRRPVLNVHHKLCLSFDPHSPAREPCQPCHHVPIIKPPSSFTYILQPIHTTSIYIPWAWITFIKCMEEKTHYPKLQPIFHNVRS